MARTLSYFAKNLAVSNGPATALQVETLGENRYAISVEGKRYEVESLSLSTQSVSVLIEGQSFAIDFEEKGDELTVFLRGHKTRFDVVDERRARLRAAAVGFTVEGKQNITAPMPGKIVKVFVKVGDAVVEGQSLIVVEAMKMENELKSPIAGTVTAVHTQENATVENGAQLITVE